MGTRGFSIGILITILIIMIIYVIFIFEMYRKKEFIFSPYTPPPAPVNAFYPLGSVRPMTQDEINTRNEIILASTGN